jgi:hypothetical protein
MGIGRVERLAGFVFAAVLAIGVGSFIAGSLLMISGQWVGAGLSLIAAAISFSALLLVLFK